MGWQVGKFSVCVCVCVARRNVQVKQKHVNDVNVHENACCLFSARHKSLK